MKIRLNSFFFWGVLLLIYPVCGFPQKIQLVPVASVAESETVLAKISIPERGEVVSSAPLWVQIRLDGYPLGSTSLSDRGDDLVHSPLGQTLRIVVDNYPFFPMNGPSLNPFNEQGYFYTEIYKFKIPFALRSGVHTLRIFPARSFGESLKGEGAFHASYFYVGDDRMEGCPKDLFDPYLTYNEPSGHMPWVCEKPVLLDFFLSNCELSKDGYKVRVTIDGTTSRILTSWQPHYIYGLGKGSHRLRLELLDSRNKTAPGLFNVVEQRFTVY